MYANSTGRLIRVEYKFGNNMSVKELVDIITSKYGPPDLEEENDMFGVSSTWSGNGTDWKISVARRGKDRRLALSYYHNQAWGACLLEGMDRTSPEQVSKHSNDAF
jgi:hypothetical protein